MNEFSITNIAFVGSLFLAVAAWLWSFAGRDDTTKAWRRYGSNLTVSIGVNVTCALMGIWSWKFLVMFPIMIAIPIGYGGEHILKKIYRRALFAIVHILAGIYLAFLIGGNAWWVFIIHAFVASATIPLGVKNPVHAAAEEFFVATLLYLGLFMYPFTFMG